uniref:3-oxoacyl-[acyl-carrier-protein] reductase FabG-like n=1 Tax=Styela clava TaxID=7725 RepID=UPI0019398DC5|nr:3-oxoacyl-[acyl-carrier-protein] reductase FabG-like [Styela clava]
MISLSGKIGVITGASSGIGRATSILFSKLGADLSLVGRNEENLKKTADECEKNGSKVISVVADVTSSNGIDKIVYETTKRFEKVNILVNNAGIIKSGTIENTTLTDFDDIMNINTRSVFQLMQLFLPHLEKTKGSIVNVSSVNGIRSFPGALAYNVSKAALNQLTRCSALELAPKGIRVNCVNPGVTLTELHKRSGMDEVAYKTFLERTKTTHALGRPGKAIEVAEAIAYLASDSSSFVTGMSLPVDGGRHAMCPR